MSIIEKSEILSLVACSGLSRRRALVQLGLPKSTYYRWLRRQTGGSLQDRKGGSPVPWNKLRPEEEERILVRKDIIGIRTTILCINSSLSNKRLLRIFPGGLDNNFTKR
ncbi:helix-turn-helix domain-containing protein [Chloroflexota bacterium]